MSAITSDWASIETEAPLPLPPESDKVYRREEEFRSALDKYIAGYVADQQERRAIISTREGQRRARAPKRREIDGERAP